MSDPTGPRPIQAGDVVEHVHQPYLDSREVTRVSNDGMLLWLQACGEIGPFPANNYRTAPGP
jgi:hypothetical protein